MRRGSVVQLLLLGLLFGAAAAAVASSSRGCRPDLEGSRPDRLRLLVRDGDLHRDLRARRRGDRLLGLSTSARAPDDDSDGPPIHGTPASRSSGRRPGRARDGDLDRERDRARPERQRSADPLKVERHRAAVRLELQVPGLREPRPPRRCACRATGRRAAHHVAGRHPLVLGARVRAEAGRRAGHDRQARDHADEERHLPGDLHRALRARPRRHALRGDRDADRPASTSWVKQQQQAAQARAPGQAGLAVFNANGCGSLPHVHGRRSRPERSGPTSISCPPTRRRPASRSRTSSRESIVDPNAYIEPGFHPNVMPATFATLPKDQLDSARRVPRQVEAEGVEVSRPPRSTTHRPMHAQAPEAAARLAPARSQPGWLRVPWMIAALLRDRARAHRARPLARGLGPDLAWRSIITDASR